MIEYLIFFLFRAQKAAKMLFQTFCPWTIQFSTDETPFVHGRRDFYLFIELFATENGRKPSLWKKIIDERCQFQLIKIE